MFLIGFIKVWQKTAADYLMTAVNRYNIKNNTRQFDCSGTVGT